MLNSIYKIKDTVDIFVSTTESTDKFLLTFHKMTTRARIEILVSGDVVKLLGLIDGKTSIRAILARMGGFNNDSAIQLIHFLIANKIIVNIEHIEVIDERYKRQVSYFDDLIINTTGSESQKNLQSKKVAILGCGAVGGNIAEILARAGVEKFIFLDYKKITLSNTRTHLFASTDTINTQKTNALSKFIKRINKKSNITTFDEMLFPHSDLSKIIPFDTDIVINSCDEPYIGYTSLKIGRFLQRNKIPLYVAGGFDAHLMSSGELIFPPKTPCIDCAQKTFNKALGDWKPTYLDVSKDSANSQQQLDIDQASQYTPGGAGRLGSMSSFSANIASLRIIHYLLNDPLFDFTPTRYEYLLNSGSVTSFKMEKQKDCNVCNN